MKIEYNNYKNLILFLVFLEKFKHLKIVTVTLDSGGECRLEGHILRKIYSSPKNSPRNSSAEKKIRANKYFFCNLLLKKIKR
jgi:hypothetical protein